MLIFRNRASAVLYDFLISINSNKIFFLPCNICPIVPITFLKAGANYEFVDISNETLCIDFNIIMDKLINNPSKYGGILFAHTYGLENSFNNEFKRMKEFNEKLIIIDDKCLCKPNFNNSSSFADITLYSTGYSKYVDIGFGGFGYINKNIDIVNCKLRYNEKDLEDIIEQYKMVIKDEEKFIYSDSNWLDNRIPEVAFNEYRNIVETKKLDISKYKKQIHNIYLSELPKEIQLPIQYQNWRFNILVPNKEEVLKKIFNSGFFASSHYSPLNKSFSNNKSFFPNANKLFSNVINLFNDKYITFEQVVSISKIINKFLRI